MTTTINKPFKEIEVEYDIDTGFVGATYTGTAPLSDYIGEDEWSTMSKEEQEDFLNYDIAMEIMREVIGASITLK